MIQNQRKSEKKSGWFSIPTNKKQILRGLGSVFGDLEAWKSLKNVVFIVFLLMSSVLVLGVEKLDFRAPKVLKMEPRRLKNRCPGRPKGELKTE